MRLHLLGVPRLEGSSASGRRSVLSQPRRAALLAYLALRSRHGPQRRDTLLGVFWPESDTDHARGALRSALHFLRVSLGPAVIQSRGSEEVQLDLAALSCDAVDFEQLCDDGDLAAALRLYAGDLLKGFFISEAPEFEQWLDGERSRLRRRASDAAHTLAAEAEARGEVGLAIHRLRYLLELEPTDEAATRHLMRLLAAADNRGEALRVFLELEARLETEFGLDPAEETRTLAEALRAGTPGPSETEPVRGTSAEPARPAAERGADFGLADPSPAAGATSATAAVGRRLIRVPVVVAASLTAAFVLVAAAVLLGPSKADAPDPDMVAVLPFEYRGAADHAYLAEGLADLLAANLNGAGELRAVDPRALLARPWPGPHPMEPRDARRVAAAHGAGLVVLGTATEAVGQLRIAAALYGPAGRATPVVVEGPADDVLGLVDRLSLSLLQARGTTGLVQATLRTTHSVEALKSFLSGEAALRKADMHAAIDHYRRATQLDSTFALAHYRLSSAAYRQGISRVPSLAGNAALRHAGRLAREDSLLVAAWYHHYSGSASEAHRLYQEALMLRPSHVEAAFQLGELLFHWGPAIGAPAAEAEEPFRRVLAVDPNDIQAALHLTRLAARDGRPQDVDSLMAGMQRADPGGTWEVELDALRAFLSDDRAWQDRAIAIAGRVPNRDRAILEHMAAFSYNLAAVERVTRSRLSVQRTHVEQVRLRLFLAHVQLARGRYRDAAADMASESAVPPARRLEYRAMMATLPFLPLAAPTLDSVRNEIAAQPDLSEHDVDGPFAGRSFEYPHLLWPGIYRPRRLYLLGALLVRLGDVAAAVTVADSLIPGDDQDGRLARQYQRLILARAAAASGRALPALSVLGPVQPPPILTFESLVDHDRPYERWLRAELLRESGRITEALRWYATFPDAIGRDLPYIAPSHLRRAEIHDAAGDRLQAAYHYRRFIELWANADPELQPEVVRARERLREVEAR